VALIGLIFNVWIMLCSNLVRYMRQTEREAEWAHESLVADDNGYRWCHR